MPLFCIAEKLGKDTAHMIQSVSASRLHDIDSKILDLLEERAAIAADLEEDGEDENPLETVQWWQEEAIERGLDDESAVERIARSLTMLRK